MSKRVSVDVWGRVPIAMLRDSTVKPNMIRVYVSLSSFQGGGEHCWPSREEIAERAGMSIAQVSRATEQLEKSNWIKKSRRSAKNQTNVYEVLFAGDVETDVQETNTSHIDRCAENLHDRCAENPHIHHITKRTKEKNNVYKAKRSPHLILGEFENVRLTQDEFDRFNQQLGQELFSECIELLSIWKEEKGRVVKNDNLAIRRWVVDAVKEKRRRIGRPVGNTGKVQALIDSLKEQEGAQA